MAWFIEGDGKRLIVGMLDSGLPYICDEAIRHEPKPICGDVNIDFYQRLESAGCAWTIHSTNESARRLNGTGFYEKIQQNPERALASIEYYDDSNMVVITIALPPQVLEYATGLFKHILVNPDICYLITLDFGGFKVPESNSAIPSIKEFLAGSFVGKTFISEEVSFLIKRNEENTLTGSKAHSAL